MIARELMDIDDSLKGIQISEIKKDIPFGFDNSKLLRNFDNFKISSKDFTLFYHKLSQYTDPKNLFKLRQTAEEIIIFKESLGRKITFEFLISLNDKLTKSVGKLRKGELFLNSNRYNKLVKFPDPVISKRRLFEIVEYVDQNKIGLKEAILVYVLILNSHAFTDGNGRLARVIFNLLVCSTSSSYLPIYEIKEMSRGGYEIRLRKAEIFNDWQPLCNYFINCIEFCEKYNH